MKTLFKNFNLFFIILVLVLITLPVSSVKADNEDTDSDEVTYSTDGGSTWHTATLTDAIWESYAASRTEIRLLKNIVLDGNNWSYSVALGGNNNQIILDGAGHTITRGEGAGQLFTVTGENSQVTLKNITIDGGAVWSDGSPASRTNSGITLTGTYYLFSVDSNSTLILENGAILQNSALGSTDICCGAAVAISDNQTGGTLIMKSGAEIRNNAAYLGGAVFVGENGIFQLEGGKIYGNYASNSGGGVTVNGTFLMTGGELSENYAAAGGGGVTVIGSSDADFSMEGGKIIKNQLSTSSMGGGVLVYNGTFSVSGSPVISQNISSQDKPNNVYLRSDKTISLSGALLSGTQIGVSASERDISAGFNNEMDSSAIPKDYFFSDDKNLVIIKNNTTNEALLHKHTYADDYVTDNNATCTKDGTKTRICSVCNEKDTITDEGSAKGHAYGPWTSIGDGTHTRICANDNTHTETDNCSGSYVTDNNASCTKDGTKTRVCPICKGTDTITDEGSAKGHAYGAWTSNGDGTHTRICSNDNTHTETENCSGGTVTEAGSATCTICGGEYGTLDKTEETGENAPHTEFAMNLKDLADAVLTTEDLETIKNGTDIKIILTVDDADNSVSDTDKTAISSLLADKYELGQYLDINLFKVIDNQKNPITQTTNNIKITITIPEALKNTVSGSAQTFAVARVHNSETTILNDLDNDDNTITIETDRFSTYAIIYEHSNGHTNDDNSGSGDSNSDNADSGNEEDFDENGAADAIASDTSAAPRTGDAGSTGLYLILIMSSGLCIIFLLCRKKHEENQLY